MTLGSGSASLPEADPSSCPACGGPSVTFVPVHADGSGILTPEEIADARRRADIIARETREGHESYLMGHPGDRDKVRQRAMNRIEQQPEAEGGCWLWTGAMRVLKDTGVTDSPIMPLGRAGTGQDIRRWLWFDHFRSPADVRTRLVPVTPEPGASPLAKACGQGAGIRCVRPSHWQLRRTGRLPGARTAGRPGAGNVRPEGAPGDVVTVIEVRADRSARVTTSDQFLHGLLVKIEGAQEQENDGLEWVFELAPAMVHFRNSRWAERKSEVKRDYLQRLREGDE